MDMREPRWQCAIAAECEDDPRRTKNVACDESERGDGRPHEKSGAANVSEKFGGRFSERGVLIIGKIGTERSLRHDLDHDVDDRCDDERQISRTWHGARRIFYLATRDQRDLDSDEGENQQNNRVAQRLAVGPGCPGEIRWMNEKDSSANEQEQREQFRERYDGHRARASTHSTHVDHHERTVNDNHDDYAHYPAAQERRDDDN